MRTSPTIVQSPVLEIETAHDARLVGLDAQVALGDDDVAQHGGVVAVVDFHRARFHDDLLVVARRLRAPRHA